MAAPWAKVIELTLSRICCNSAGVGQSRLLAISFSSSRSSASVSPLSVTNSAPGVAMEHSETLLGSRERGWMPTSNTMLDHEARSSARKLCNWWQRLRSLSREGEEFAHFDTALTFSMDTGHERSCLVSASAVLSPRNRVRREDVSGGRGTEYLVMTSSRVPRLQ